MGMKRGKQLVSMLLAATLCAGFLPARGASPVSAETAAPQWEVKELVPCKYDQINTVTEELAQVRVVADDDSYKFGLIDTTGREVAPCKYDHIGDFSEGLASVRVGDYETGKWSLIDESGQEVASCENHYDDIYRFSDGLALVRVGGWEAGKCGFIDTTGQEIIPCEYEYANSFSEGIALVKMDGKYGFINVAGQEIIPYKYDDATDFSGGIAAVKMGEKWGLIDMDGQEVAFCKYDGIWFIPGAGGLPVAYMDGKLALVDQTGTEIVLSTYYELLGEVWKDGLLGVALENSGVALPKEHTYGVIDSTGKVIIEPKYDMPYDEYGDADILVAKTRGNFLWVSLDGKQGLFDREGDEVVPLKYDYIGNFSEGLAAVRVGDPETGKWGFIDESGTEVVQCENHYDRIYSFSEGLALVRIGTWMAGKYGFLDTTGQEIVPCMYDYADSFIEGLAVVGIGEWQTGYKYGVIDATGQEVIPCEYDSTIYLGGGFVQVGSRDGNNTKYGLLSITKKAEAAPDPTQTPDTAPTPTPTPTPTTPPASGASSGGSSSGSRPTARATPTPKPTATPAPTAAPTSTPTPTPTPAPIPASERFADVAAGSWYEAGVTFVTDKGLFHGMTEGEFAPELNMTRAMLMTVLARLDGQETDGGSPWYAKSMDWAKKAGISDGTMPESNVSREQLVTMLYRYAKAAPGKSGLSGFVDGDTVSPWAVDAVTWAVTEGIMTGTDWGGLYPQGTATRAEVAVLFQRFVEKIGK